MSVGPSGCCGGEDDAEEKPTSQGLALAGCCSSAPGTDGEDDATVHGGLAELLKRYDVNDFAASVKVYAVKR
jgi:hypothetical protein